MKKVCVFILTSVFLSACAGNPPAWWNPRNIQPGQTSGQQSQRAVSAAPRGETSSKVPVNMNAEELISVPDEGYEEMALTPLQDEEQENTTGETSSQVMAEEEASLVPSILSE